MMKALILALTVCVLSGCANFTHYGDFAGLAPVEGAKLASDAASALATVRTPARTRLNFQQFTNDEFGSALVNNLRNKGYAVAEYSPVSWFKSSSNPGVKFNYVIDHIDDDLCRVTLFIGTGSISRVYQQSSGNMAAAGYWVRKE